ncbi:MAG: hypothetical protein IKB70_06195 [Bacilli bacterium]|nr:hypothetical protein [Bacilli bacterium]
MNVKIDYDTIVNKIKIMHAVNNGPVKQPGAEQVRSNFEDFKRAKIPYVRNHDASFTEEYGAEHTVDIVAIFPDFNKDPYDPNSYDFQFTDEYTKIIIDAGSKVFYRLGNKIEHGSKKYGIVVPADYQKWAVICEHIIRHYNEGWANGFYYNIEYWEIWNEADGIALDGTRPNWTGNNQDYFDMYVVAARHLKNCFPNLKIGGPALTSAGSLEFANGLLTAIKQNGVEVPLDFFSYHMYHKNPQVVKTDAKIAKDLLHSYGFDSTEIILNEWNYLEDWTVNFISTIQSIIGIKGAAFQMAVMTEGQNSPIDMMMYYTAQPSCFNGLFDYYTFKPLKGYYAILLFSALYDLGSQVLSNSDDKDLYVLSAVNGKKSQTVLTYYDQEEKRQNESVVLNLPKSYDKICVKIVDAKRELEEISYTIKDSNICFEMPPNSIVSVICE